VYQQWQFNDLTQASQPSPNNRISSTSKAKLKHVKLSKGSYYIQRKAADCQDGPRSTYRLATDVRLCESNDIPCKSSKQRKCCKIAKEAKYHTSKQSYFTPSNEIKHKKNNYRKIKIILGNPSFFLRAVPRIMPFKVDDFERRRRKKISMAKLDDNCLDPFAFVTISDQIKRLSPNKACLRLPHEFVLAKKQISIFQSTWAHRITEFEQ
jgi:hypothetical protein